MEGEQHGANCQCHKYLLSQGEDNVNHLVDFEGSKVLNAKRRVDLKAIFRAESDKHLLAADCALESFPDDPQLVIIVRFREETRLRAIDLIARAGQRPAQLGVYINVEHFLFADTRNPPDQSFPLQHFTPRDEIEVYPELRKASNTRTLVLFLSGPGPQLGLSYVGLKGFSTRAKPTIFRAKYELRNTAAEEGAEELKMGVVPF